MAELYDGGVAGLLDQSMSWQDGEAKVTLVARGYTFSAAHRTVKDLGAHANGTSDALTGCRYESRVGKADPSYVLADRPDYSTATVVHVNGRLLTYSPISPVQPVRGQRVDVAWPDNEVFAL